MKLPIEPSINSFVKDYFTYSIY